MADKEGNSGAEHHKQKTTLKELAKQEKIFLQTQKLKTAGKTKQKNANIKNNESIAKEDGIMPEVNTVTLPNSFSFFNDKFE